MNATQRQKNYLQHQFGRQSTVSNIEQSVGFSLTRDEKQTLKEE